MRLAPSAWSAVIPGHMQTHAQWVAWGPDPESGKPKCPLIIGATWRRASSTDPTTWRTFAAARAHLERYPGTGTGVGYVFTVDDGLVFIDFDHCLDDGGALKDWARSLVAPFVGRTYVERSPSGRGLHVFARGTASVSGKRLAVGDGAVEVYTRARYSTVTGDIYQGSDLLDDAQGAIDLLLGRAMPARPTPPPRARIIHLDAHRDYRTAGEALRWLDPDLPYSDWLLVGQALHSRWPDPGGPGFRLWDYWSGRGAKYPGSEALARKWGSFHAGGGITLGSLIHLARTNGARHHA